MRTLRVSAVLLGTACVATAACNIWIVDAPQGCDQVSYDNNWSQLDLTLYLDFIEDCPRGGVSFNETLNILGSVEDNSYDDVDNPNPTTNFASLTVYRKINSEPCVTSFFGLEVGYQSEFFWFTGFYPNRKWVANASVQFPAKTGDPSGDCVVFQVVDSYVGYAEATAEVTYN